MLQEHEVGFENPTYDSAREEGISAGLPHTAPHNPVTIPQYSSGSDNHYSTKEFAVNPIATIITEPVAMLANGNAALYRENMEERAAGVFPPSSNAVLTLVVLLLCGIANPCAIIAIKKSCDSAQSLNDGCLLEARREGVAAKQYAYGAMLLGLLFFGIIFYFEVMSTLHQILVATMDNISKE